jgi:hypothetical protein
MGPPSYMRSLVDQNVVMRRMTEYDFVLTGPKLLHMYSPCCLVSCGTEMWIRIPKEDLD